MGVKCKKCGKSMHEFDGCTDGKNGNFLCNKCSDKCVNKEGNCILGCFPDNSICRSRSGFDQEKGASRRVSHDKKGA